MNITWHGLNCFKISAAKGKGEAVNIVIDPFSKDYGLRPVKADADIVFFASPKQKVEIPESSFVIDGPGEYDVKGVYVHGMQLLDNPNGCFYVLETEDLRLCHLGLVGPKGLSSEQIEEIGEIDVLMIPVGSLNGSIDAKQAIKIISDIEPKITIPMGYKISGMKDKADGVDVFLKALGMKSIVPVPKLNIKKKDVSSEEAKIILLEP